MGDRFTAVLANELTEITRLGDRLTRFGREHHLSERAVQHMVLALDELITNVIEHGSPARAGDGPRPAPQIRVRVWLAEGNLHAELTDEGMAFNPFAEAADPDLAAALEDRPIGGLGVHFVRTVMDQASYRREGRRNVIRLMKSLHAA